MKTKAIAHGLSSQGSHLLLGHAFQGRQPALRAIELQVLGDHQDLRVADLAAHALVGQILAAHRSVNHAAVFGLPNSWHLLDLRGVPAF